MSSLQREIAYEDNRIGAKGEKLEGDFWFPSKPKDVPPILGHVTVIVGESEPSRAFGAMLRRWKLRFPNLDIVYTASTRGFFREMEPPSPEIEAKYLRRLIQDFYNYPASVVVTSTQFWRLPNPDRRRINEQTNNQKNYGDMLWLLDQAGRIIHYSYPIRSLRAISPS